MLKLKTTVVVLLVLSASACALASGGEAATEEQSIFSGTFADSLMDADCLCAAPCNPDQSGVEAAG